ncbi:MAG: radical SAM protein [Deltaproteobacteria bacterium]|nr:radical SAM protein [Deltaproteobacteria bacterium]
MNITVKTKDTLAVQALRQHAPRVVSKTQSVCPKCLKRIDARLSIWGDAVFLEKTCADHGLFSTCIWRGSPGFESWTRPKVPTCPPVCHTKPEKGCPFDCGLCPEHRQRTCATLLEVTHRCNLQCPVCFAHAGVSPSSDPVLEEINEWLAVVMRTAGDCNLQLSGGEPTVRDDLPDIIAMAKKSGFSFIQLNTNGLRLATDPDYVKSLKDAGLSSVFLQFDGVDDHVFLKLRGRALITVKERAVENCIKNNIGIVLVPTIVKGLNDGQIGALVDAAMDFGPGVRGIHFQPLSCFGRFPKKWNDRGRITLPEILQALENQTRGRLRVSHFKPPGCENALCSFQGSFLRQPEGTLIPLNADSGKCCPGPEFAEAGALKAISSVAQKWTAPEFGCHTDDLLSVKGKTEVWHDFDVFIDTVAQNRFSISAMAFQDAWTLDLERLRDCCIHIFSPKNQARLIPFCAYNLTDIHGQSIYRRPSP